MKRFCLALLLVGAAGAASAQLGSSSTRPACCQLTTSLIQDVLNTEPPSDERFLGPPISEGLPPNIHFIVDVSGSMRELPQINNSNYRAFYDATVNGCENPALQAFSDSRGWDPTFQYPVPDMGTGIGTDVGFPNLFQDSKYYAMGVWGSLSNPTPQWGSKEEACQKQIGDSWNKPSGAAQYARCLQCLSTKGYFKVFNTTTNDETNTNFILWGRFLNFNPPKYVAAKAVLKQIIKDLNGARVGISIFTATSQNVQKMKPACNEVLANPEAFSSYRADFIARINTLAFNTSTPLARSLLNAGYYFTSGQDIYKDVFGFGFASPIGYAYPNDFKGEVLTSENRTVCWGNQGSAVILVSDGEPNNDTLSTTVVTKIRALNGGKVDCPPSAPCPDASNDANYMLDDVAKLLFTQDLQRSTPPVVGNLDTTGPQQLRLYTVGFGINSNLLKSAAAVGGGIAFTATDAASLKQAIQDALFQEKSRMRVTALAAPSVDSLLVNGQGTAIVPRLQAVADMKAPRKGFLYRFQLTPEKGLGCDPVNPWFGDLNGDGDCDDTHLLDVDGDAVVENFDGTFVKQANRTVPARPFWEAGQVLKPSAAPTAQWQNRRIFTLVDGNADGKLDHRDTPVAFSEANAALLMDSLGISQNPAGCEDLRTQLGLASLTPAECAKLVIRWYRGADALHADPAQRGNDRPFLLHDIFHSTPITVEPPLPKALCGTSPQCTPALYSGATLLQDSYSVPGQAQADAYEKYVAEAGGRDKIILVGSNGGMLHAFHGGRRVSTDPATGLGQYDAGTGQELWAFVPPDLLPKMRPNLGKHAYFVDGTPMVREVWMDGVGSDAQKEGMKQWSEFRTVAVVGTGRGGVHHFALDLTDLLAADLPGQPRVPDQAGAFLWMWPQPCDGLALQVGQSISHFSPQSPPIGPVALSPDADDALRILKGSWNDNPLTPWLIDGKLARERWVVALNGGYDTFQLRGRGLALVDLSSGHTVWSFFLGDGQGRSEHLRYPVTAGLALADVGSSYGTALEPDQLVDTATVGDYGGQLWTLRFWRPGEWDAATQRVSNWHAARSFRAANLANRTGHPEALRGPFASMATHVAQQETGFLRAFVGTGDRQNLSDAALVCRPGNPRACAEQGCTVENTLRVSRGHVTAAASTASYQAYAYWQGGETLGASGPACEGLRVQLSSDQVSQGQCVSSRHETLDYQCDGTVSSWSCRAPTDTRLPFQHTQGQPLYPERFYGLWSYGGHPSRTFNSPEEAAAFDSQLLSDWDLLNVGQFEASGSVVMGELEAASMGAGWYLQYGSAFQRTSTAATTVGGCVLWNSLEALVAPPVGSLAGPAYVSRLYQADFVTGKAQCASGFSPVAGPRARFQAVATPVSLPETVPQRLLLGGQVHSSVLLSTPNRTVGTQGQVPLVSIPVSP
ncbi:type IV pilus assembly protein PilY1 [Stigmatella aurantiaca]|uniref:Type IV pilus assembly protein PilY1 n=1 Tax=Stigmatella aurantiaca TaxID=41 RepID=A0A1H7M6R0_STIAU|nr:pilus assembly protein PilY [Stigmatella aurantiaca]SEL06628.1 type IV pilus assembly protein PilY1 [Stigmatella aurantiaca]